MASLAIRDRVRKISIFALIIACGGGLIWHQISSRTFLVTKVVDGDTIDLKDGRTIRYLNLDTPELGKGQTADECFAVKATEINKKLVLGKKVRLEMDKNEMDNFGRILAYVYVKKDNQEIFVNQNLLEKGAAIYQLDTVNLKHTETLVEAANQAHEQKKGLWQECAPDPKVGCQIKGNLDRLDKRWYHLPDFRHYDQTTVNLEHGDQWFCTENALASTSFPDTNWHHITVISSSDITANQIYLGRISTNYYPGQLDDVKIWNYALTATQVKNEFNAGSAVRFGD